MIAELQPVWMRWQETHEALVDCLQQFPAGEVETGWAWRPAPRVPSPGEIIRHTAGGEVHYALRIRAALSGTEPEEWREAVWDTLGRQETPDRASLLELVDRARAFALETLESLTAADLGRTVAESWSPLGPRVEGPLDVLWFIEQMNRHKAYHVGQLWYAAQILDS